MGHNTGIAWGAPQEESLSKIANVPSAFTARFTSDAGQSTQTLTFIGLGTGAA